MRLIEELKRRNVFRVGVAYVIAAWVLLQFADLVLDNIDAPGWVIKVFMLALAIGFPLAIFFAWAFELTPDGIKREKDVDRTQSITAQTGRKLDRSIIVILLIAVAYLGWKNFSQEEGPGSISPQGTPGTESTAQVELNPTPASNLPPASSNPAPAAQNSIAVLPFVNMSTDAENEFFSDGISEEILNVLASIPDLKVAARTSAFAFKGSNTGIAEIARTLGVNHVLEGSVRKAGNKVRITAQLIKADDGFHLWSANYDRELTDIFEIQDEIANSIADALKVSLKLETRASGNLTGTMNITAYERYLKGMSLWHLRTADSLNQSIEEFNQAIDLDPQFAKAYAGLSLAWGVIDGYVMMDPVTASENAEGAANKALSLDPENVEALASLALVKSNQFMYAEATELFKRAIELNPSFATAHQWYGNMLSFMSTPEAGLVELQKAWSLDPRSRIIGVNVAMTLGFLDRQPEAIDQLNEVIDFAPDFPDALEQLLHTEIIVGDCKKAAAYGNQLAGVLNKVRNTTQVYVDLCQGSDPEARNRAIDEMLAWPTLNFPEPDNPSLSYAVELVATLAELNMFEAALQLIEKNMDFDGTYIFTNIRARKSKNAIAFLCDPRFQALYRKYDIPALESDNRCH